MRTTESFLYNLENLKGGLIEHNVTAEFLREEYGINCPSRAARRGDRVKGKFRIIIVGTGK